MGLLPLTYSRPSHVSREEFEARATSPSERASLRSGRSSLSAGIPDALAFDKIIAGETCPPMSVRDFMNYLLFIEFSAENLQFYLWYQSYSERFRKAPKSDLALAPEWTREMEEEIQVKLQREATEKMRRRPKRGQATDIFEGTDFEKRDPMAAEAIIELDSPPVTPKTQNDVEEAHPGELYNESVYCPSSLPSVTSTLRSPTSEAFHAAGAKAPFTIQPFREEIDRIISTYIMTLLHALSYTTHPSALDIAFKSVDASLRFQSHPNFVRWSVCNGNPPRVSFARVLGFSGIALSFGLAVMLVLSTASRGWRGFLAFGWAIGICTVVASYKGMCICMYAMHHRHIRPWELFLDAEEGAADSASKRSFDSLSSSNSFEDEPWLANYSSKNLMRKIFDKEAWIEEPVLRQIQDTIFVQSLLIGSAASAVLAVIFVFIPSGNFFSF
ncbi:unnamed protein product [Parascedosporium putredinis]|uniref:Regulator of G protein signaling superfamily n=1 Tax=Parascedosporium putredinis TaxID=1442378 RepID=A0A9P1HED0_9PEZI|nr:unnamed protein product [Parascedosporium putredinis]CAI8004888.1 unnamed protein product [Parascedosporium putredinis]